ncbi:MAG: hypothetical protein IPO99_19415 [Nitrospira sp.]|nr:hypothetical protein [Nitrospira sp.]
MKEDDHGNTEDTEGIDAKQPAEIKGQKEAALCCFDPLQREHQDETGMDEEEQHAKLAEIIRQPGVRRDEEMKKIDD